MGITIYDLKTTAVLTSLEPDAIRQYCEIGLIETHSSTEEFQFTDETVFLLRRIRYLTQERGINLDGISIILNLMREVTQLRSELKFQREHVPN